MTITLLIICFSVVIWSAYKHLKFLKINLEYFNGIIHPQPFSDDPNSTRATKTLILIIANFIITFLVILNKNKYFLNNTKYLFIPFSILNFLIYKAALSRSDGPHIQQASYFTIMLFSFFLLYFILNYLNRKKIFSKKNIYLAYIFVFFFLSFILFNNISSFKNIYTFPKNISNFIKSEDKKFINKKYSDLIEELNLLTANSNCVQVFSYDQAIFYLM